MMLSCMSMVFCSFLHSSAPSSRPSIHPCFNYISLIAGGFHMRLVRGSFGKAHVVHTQAFARFEQAFCRGGFRYFACFKKVYPLV
jgi:hypothetical protein